MLGSDFQGYLLPKLLSQETLVLDDPEVQIGFSPSRKFIQYALLPDQLN
jgi:hypothetical protein